MRVPELLQKRAALHAQVTAILDKVADEKRTSVNGEEQTKLDAIEADMRGVSDLIAREQRAAALSAELGLSAGQQQQAAGAQQRQVAGSDRGDAALRSWIRSGLSDLNEEFRSILRPSDLDPEVRNSLLGYKDAICLRAASPLSDVTGSAGAYTIPQGFYATLTDAMKWYGGIAASRATVLRTATGNTLPMPTANDTTNTGELVAENTATTQASTEMSFGQTSLSAYKISSKYVLVPIELLQDSYFDIGAFVAKKLGQRIGRTKNTYATTGTGSSQPQGIITGSTLGKTTASATAITYGEIKALEHSVDPAYRAGAEFMFHDSIALYLEQMVDGNSRPILISSLQGLNGGAIEAGNVNKKVYLNGYPTVINQDMASAVTTGLKTMLFGDTSTFFVREVMDIVLVRFSELYMSSGQVGFLAFYRFDSKCLDAGTHPLKYMAQA